MIIALSIMLVTTLLIAGIFTLVESDTSLGRGDLDGKRAYAAAQAGAQYYLGQLNENAANSSWWQTCANDTTNGQRVAVPGATDETYAYQPVVNSCAAGKAIGTVLDPNTGLLRMEFTGRAGQYGQQRTIVADFRPLTPLSYLWFTAHETVDPGADSACNGNRYSPRADAPTDSSCWLTWGANDSVNGPMYTQDQFYIANSSSGATFGRNRQDAIASSGSTQSICVTGNNASVPSTTPCPSSLNIKGTQKPGATFIPLTTDNQTLPNDAAAHGLVLRPGTTTLTLALNASGQTVIKSGETCSANGSCLATAPNGTALAGQNLTKKPIVYAPSSTTDACATKYDPTNVSYTSTTVNGSPAFSDGGCGDLYVQGTYASSLTLDAANDIVVTGSLLNQTDPTGATMPTGSATLGLVATQYVRVYHSVDHSQCSGAASPVTIDGAILALNHSFLVDNYTCGAPSTLTVHGAIAQQYRGPVALVGNADGSAGSGYNKNYNYDDRLEYTLPAYLFDLQNTSWNLVRETECAPNLGSTSPQSCSYTGS